MKMCLDALFLLLAFPALVVAKRSFIESIRLDRPFKTQEEMYALIGDLAAKREGSFFSLGETHSLTGSYDSVAYLVNRNMAFRYMNASFESRGKKAKLCFESLPDFFQSESAQILIPLAKGVDIISNADFSPCWSRGENILLYSGVYHQFPFVENYPVGFARNSVTLEERNMIYGQFKEGGANSLFVANFELRFLESVGLVDVLTEAYSPENFRGRMGAFYRKIDLLRDEMEVLYRNGDFVIRGLFVSRENIFPPENDVVPETAYFLVTDHLYKGQNTSLRLPLEIVHLDDDAIDNILGTIQRGENSYIFSSIIGLHDGEDICSDFIQGSYRTRHPFAEKMELLYLYDTKTSIERDRLVFSSDTGLECYR